METVFFNGQEVHTYGKVPEVGAKAPEFNLAGRDLSNITLADYAGKRVVLNVFPSLDTPVCAASVRKFNKETSDMDNVVVLCVSMDLPFAMQRFCTLEGLENVVPASAFRSPEFGKNYGLQITDGPLAGLLARCVLIIDENGKVAYRDLVSEITHEPDYEAAKKVLEGKY
ncbi:MAG: thiol peroxidase [Muribaculaceae bacterium]|nr:thiol peroxidase [Muribaculaceae bacterium]